METFLVVTLVAVFLQILDFLSIREIIKVRGAEVSLTILPRAIVKRTPLLASLKIISGLIVGTIYVAVVQAAGIIDVWPHSPWIIDLYLGSMIIVLVISSGIRLFLSRHEVAPSADKDSQLSGEVAVLLFISSIVGLLGIILTILITSLLLLGASITLFVTYLLSRHGDMEKQEDEDEEIKPSQKIRLSKGAKALLMVATICLSSYAIWNISSSEDVWVPSDYASEGIVTNSPRLVIQSDGFSFMGHREATARDIPGSAFQWYSGVDGTLEKFRVQADEGNRTVVISNDFGSILTSTVETVRLSPISIRDCTRVWLYRPDFTVRVVGENTTTFLRIEKDFGINVTFDLMRVPDRTRAYLTSKSDKDSTLHVTCSAPTIYLDDVEHSYNGTVYLYVENFDQLDIEMTLVEDSSMIIRGSSSFSFENAKANIDNVQESSLSSRGYYERLQGQIHILEADEIRLSFAAEDFSYVTQSQIVPFGLEISGGMVYSLENDEGSPFLPAIHTVHSVESDELRMVAVSLVILTAFTIVLATFFLPGKLVNSNGENNADSGEEDGLRMKLLALLVAALIIFPVAHMVVNSVPVGYYLHRIPVDLEIWVEDGVDMQLVQRTMELFEYVTNQLIGLKTHTIDYHQIPSDGKDEYRDGDPEMWGPPGSRYHDLVLMSAGVRDTYHITFLKGRGDDFIGKSNYGASISIFLRGDESPFRILDTLIHEFGHSLGFRHNAYSRMMATGNKTWPLYPESYRLSDDRNYRGVDLFGDARNGTVQGFPDWGLMDFQFLSRRESGESNSTSNIFVFLNEETNSLHQVIYRRFQYPDGDVAETVTIDHAPFNWFFWSFSLSERVYILNSISGSDAPVISDKWSS